MTHEDDLRHARQLAAPATEDTAGRAGPARRLAVRLLAPVHDRQRRSTEALVDAVAAAVETLDARQDALERRLDDLAADMERLAARGESEAIMADDLGAALDDVAQRMQRDLAVLRARLDGVPPDAGP